MRLTSDFHSRRGLATLQSPSVTTLIHYGYAELKKRSRDIQRKFDAVMRKHKHTKVGEVLDILDKDGGTKLKDSDIKQINKYLTKFKGSKKSRT